MTHTRSRITPVGLLFVALAALPLVHCPYINTFYNAREAFDQAQRLHRRQMREYPDSLMTPTGEALTKYDRAIAKSAKVLEVYPRRPRRHDDAIFLAAKAHFYKRDMTAAVRQLKRLQEDMPGSPFVPESYLYLGQAYMYDERYDLAEETFQFALTKYPQLNRNEEVSLLLASLAMRREGKGAALELLEKVSRAVKAEDKKIEIALRMATIHMDLKQYDKAVALLRRCPRNKKLPALMFRVDYSLVGCYLATDSLDAAQTLLTAMLRNKRYQPWEAQVLLKQGSLFTARGRPQEAIRAYERVTDKHEATAQAGDAWYALGVIYQMTLGDPKKAKECYDKAAAVAAADSTMLSVARSRSKALQYLDTLRARIERPDTADTANPPVARRYRMGEVFWLQLDQADSAYCHFKALIADTSVTPRYRSKSLYAAGWIALHALKDTSAADSLFGRLVAEFPANEYSKRAQMERGRTVTVATREDSAQAGFAAAEKLWLDENLPVKAAEAYLKVYSDYPDSRVAPQALYAAAWVCDNVTFRKDAAQFLYKKVCDKFPLGEYCERASKPRLRMALDTAMVRKELERQGKNVPKTK